MTRRGGPGPYEARQSDQSALAQSMAVFDDPVTEAFRSYLQSLTGQGQGGGWFGMNTIAQELNRLAQIRQQSGGLLSPAWTGAFVDSAIAPGFGAMGTVGDVARGAGVIFRVVPDGVDPADAFRPRGGQGVYAFDNLDSAKEFQMFSGGRIVTAPTKPYKPTYVSDWDIETYPTAGRVVANKGDQGLYPRGQQLYFNDADLIDATAAKYADEAEAGQ